MLWVLLELSVLELDSVPLTVNRSVDLDLRRPNQVWTRRLLHLLRHHLLHPAFLLVQEETWVRRAELAPRDMVGKARPGPRVGQVCGRSVVFSGPDGLNLSQPACIQAQPLGQKHARLLGN